MKRSILVITSIIFILTVCPIVLFYAHTVRQNELIREICESAKSLMPYLGRTFFRLDTEGITWVESAQIEVELVQIENVKLYNKPQIPNITVYVINSDSLFFITTGVLNMIEKWKYEVNMRLLENPAELNEIGEK